MLPALCLLRPQGRSTSGVSSGLSLRPDGAVVFAQMHLALAHGAPKALLHKMWVDNEGQDIAEYAAMLAVILVIVVGTIRLVGSQANNVFSETASAIGG